VLTAQLQQTLENLAKGIRDPEKMKLILSGLAFLECGSALLCRFGFSCFSSCSCAVRKNRET
jgi:hypothetical protein